MDVNWSPSSKELKESLMPSVLYSTTDISKDLSPVMNLSLKVQLYLWYSWIHQEALILLEQSLARPLLTYGSQLHPCHPSSLWSHHTSRLQGYNAHLHSENAHCHILIMPHAKKKKRVKKLTHIDISKKYKCFIKIKVFNQLVIKGT